MANIKTSLFMGTPDMPEVKYVHLYTGEFDENIKKASDAGFDGVELIIGDPDTTNAEELEKALKKYGKELACINTGRLNSQFGLTLLHTEKQVRQKAVDKFKSVVRLASRFGCYANIGIFRGAAIEGRPISYTRDMFVEILKELCDFASEHHVSINFEPTNRFEINFINTTNDGLDVINRVNRPNLGLLLDLYHMYLEDNDLLSMIVYCRSVVKHFHFSDSDRWPAGVSHGEIDFPALIRILTSIGYNGFLSEGLVRSEDADLCAAETARYLKQLINN
jgi:5-keto-L-gluconate epimerase